MVEGVRDNGLRCGNYAPMGDLDPRVADAVLVALRAAEIAAYVTPVQGGVGDRLYVDDQRIADARRIVDEETAPDFEASWQQVLTSLQSDPAHLSTPWPERENLTLAEREEAYDAAAAAAADIEDEHFVPPPPPPLPRLRPVTLGALAVMALAVAVMATDIAGNGMDILAFVAFVAAAVSLVYNMRQGPPGDDGSDDDGAVV